MEQEAQEHAMGQEASLNQFYEPENVHDWRSSLPPELQGTVEKFNSPESLVKAYKDAQCLIGKRVGEYAQQDWQSYAAIQEQMNNIPASPDKYEIDMTVPEGRINTFIDEDIEALKEVSHAMGLNKEQSQQMYNVMNELGNRVIEMYNYGAQETYQASLEDLGKSWGNAYESKLNAANNCIERILPQFTGVAADDIRDELYRVGAHSSPVIMKTLAALGELVTDSGSKGYNNISPMDAGMRYEQLKSNPDTANILMNPRHPMYGQTKQELQTLLKIKNREI